MPAAHDFSPVPLYLAWLICPVSASCMLTSPHSFCIMMCPILQSGGIVLRQHIERRRPPCKLPACDIRSAAWLGCSIPSHGAGEIGVFYEQFENTSASWELQGLPENRNCLDRASQPSTIPSRYLRRGAGWSRGKPQGNERGLAGEEQARRLVRAPQPRCDTTKG